MSRLWLTDIWKVESSAVFCLSRIRNISRQRNNFFPSQPMRLNKHADTVYQTVRRLEFGLFVKKHFTINANKTTGWIFSHCVISSIPEVAICLAVPLKILFFYHLRCDSRNLGLSPLCDLDRNIPMPARFEKFEIWLLKQALLQIQRHSVGWVPRIHPCLSRADQGVTDHEVLFCFQSLPFII